MKMAVATRAARIRERRYRRKALWFPYLLVAPGAICVATILGYPLLKGIAASFVQENLMVPGSAVFVGVKHYMRLLKDDIFSLSLLNTLIWTCTVVIAESVIGLATALLLNEQFPGRGVFRSLILIPWVVPSVAAALTWKWIYADQFGVLNYILKTVGIIQSDLSWLGDPTLAFASVIMAGIWKGVPFVAIVLLAGLQSIPKDFYEAARIDGARSWQSFLYVTLPQLKGIALITFLLSCIWTFNQFDLVYVMTKGGPANTTQLLPIYTYLTAFNFFDFNYAAAIAGVILLALAAGAFLYMRALRMEEAG